MGKLTQRGSLDNLRKACNALDTALNADELATALSRCLIEALGFEQVLFLIPQTDSEILCLTVTRNEEDDPSSPLRFHSLHPAMTPDDRAWLDDVSVATSPEVDSNLSDLSPLYQVCLKQLSAHAFLCFPLRCAQELWSVLLLPEPTGPRNWRDHLLPLLTILTQHVEFVLQHVQPAHDEPNGSAAKEYDGNEIVGVLAHELRNPLNSIKAAAQFLRAKYNDHASIFKFLNIIIDEVDHLSHLTTTLLEFARPLQLEMARHDVNAFVRHVLHFMGHVFSQHNIEVATTLAADLPPVCIDIKQMEQAMRNGLLNAIEAMPRGGTLRITTQHADGKQVQIRIMDDGVGIQHDEADKVFASFYTTKPNGTGLGLPVLHKIVRSHGGFVSLESQPGVGTSLIISLPGAEVSKATESQATSGCVEEPSS
jgi:signal transduction histidine kinase